MIKISKREKILLLLAGFVILAAFYYYFLYIPAVNRATLLRQELTSLNEYALSFKDLNTINEYKKELSIKGGILPSSLDHKQVLTDLERIFNKHDAILTTMSISETVGDADYQTISFNIRLELEQGQLVTMVKDIDIMPYVHSIKDMAMSMIEPGIIDMSMTIEVYYSSRYGVDDI